MIINGGKGEEGLAPPDKMTKKSCQNRTVKHGTKNTFHTIYISPSP